MNLDQVLTEAKDGQLVNVTLVSNQNNGIVSYAEGSLSFHPQTGGTVLDGPKLRPAHMEPASPLKMVFSYRRPYIVPVGGFGAISPQQFDANQPESLSLSMMSLADHQTISVSIKVTHILGKSVKFDMKQMGDLFVGVGPSLGQSSGAVFVLAFTGIIPMIH